MLERIVGKQRYAQSEICAMVQKMPVVTDVSFVQDMTVLRCAANMNLFLHPHNMYKYMYRQYIMNSSRRPDIDVLISKMNNSAKSIHKSVVEQNKSANLFG